MRVVLAALAALGAVCASGAGAQQTYTTTGVITNSSVPSSQYLGAFSLVLYLSNSRLPNGDYLGGAKLILNGVQYDAAEEFNYFQYDASHTQIIGYNRDPSGALTALDEGLFPQQPGLPSFGNVPVVIRSDLRLVFGSTNLDGDIYTLTVGVPEAATWATMLVGITATGVVLRRSRRRVAALA